MNLFCNFKKQTSDICYESAHLYYELNRLMFTIKILLIMKVYVHTIDSQDILYM